MALKIKHAKSSAYPVRPRDLELGNVYRWNKKADDMLFMCIWCAGHAHGSERKLVSLNTGQTYSVNTGIRASGRFHEVDATLSVDDK